MDDAVDEEEARREDREHGVVHRERRVERQQAEELAARHRLDAVLAAGERRLQGEEEDHLREGQRDHGEVDALAANRRQPGDQAKRRRRRGAGEDRQLRREAPHLGGVRADVARRAEKHGVPEGQQADETEQQVEGAGE